MNTHQRNRITAMSLCAVITTGLLLASFNASAAIITYSFYGITSSGGYRGNVTGTFSYDTATVDPLVRNTSIGQYSGATVSLLAQDSTGKTELELIGAVADVTVHNDYSALGSAAALYTDAIYNDGFKIYNKDFIFEIYDGATAYFNKGSPAMFDSDSLPTSLPLLINEAYCIVSSDPYANPLDKCKETFTTLSVLGRNYEKINSFELVPAVAAVPIPATVWLFGSGLIGLAGIAKRKRA